jgi:large subunit ribosomal protein L24
MKSKRPSKQRKELYDAGGHRIRKLMSAPLSSELRGTQGRRLYQIRKGDTVKIVRGDFAGVEGKVTEIDRGSQRIFVEGVTREKTSGTSSNVSVHCSKVLITKLNIDDKWRAESLKLASVKEVKEGSQQ